LDIESLKLDAEALGIKYRSDIKAETLQKKIDEFNTVNNPTAVVQTVEPAYQTYKNTSNVNVFTEDGRCGPQKTVKLTADEALKYTGLELCVS